MVGLIVVGDAPPANLDAAKALKVPPLAQNCLDRLFTEAASAS